MGMTYALQGNIWPKDADAQKKVLEILKEDPVFSGEAADIGEDTNSYDLEVSNALTKEPQDSVLMLFTKISPYVNGAEITFEEFGGAIDGDRFELRLRSDGTCAKVEIETQIVYGDETPVELPTLDEGMGV